MQVFTSKLALASAAVTCVNSHQGLTSWDVLAQSVEHALKAVEAYPSDPETLADADRLPAQDLVQA